MIGNYIKATSGGGGTTLTTAKLMKTGQTISYRTGDDGDLQEGRDVDFFTLAENNPFGNTDRFTDEFGTQVYANDIVIDWSTYNGSEVLGWYRITSIGDWNTAIDNSLLVSIGSFTSGWKLPNITELFSIALWDYPTRPLNYNPFNINLNVLWSSTTSGTSTGQALVLDVSSRRIMNNLKGATTYIYMPCRIFTVSGTTLS